MSMVEKILVMCSEQDVGLSLQDGALEVLFDDMPSEELVDLLKQHKADLVDYLNKHQRATQFSPLKPIGELAGPLSFGQKRLWFIDQLEHSSAHYNMPLALELKGTLNKEALTTALNQLLQRHSVLRTKYDVGGGRQVVQQNVNLVVEQKQLSQTSPLQSQIDQLMAEEQLRPFALNSDLMIRCTLLEADQSYHILMLTIHHIACDGWSLGVLVKELTALYENALNGSASDLPALPLQYLDYAFWQDANRDNFEQQLSFWSQYLAQLPTLHSLHTDNPRPAYQSFKGDNVSLALSVEQRESIKGICRDFDVTPFMFCYSVFSLLISKLSNEQDIAIGTPIANRSQASVESLIGYFANTLTLRTNVDSKLSFSQYLAHNKTAILDVFEHQDVPFEMIVDRVQPERNLSYSPLYQIVFSFHSHGKAHAKMPAIELTDITPKAKTVKTDLELAVIETESGMTLDWNFSTDLFNRKTIEGYGASFATLLANILAHPDQLLSQYSILTAEEEKKLNSWTSGEVLDSSLHNPSVHGLISDCAKTHPKSVAVVSQGISVCYSELEQYANKVAHYLVTNGIQSNQIVGVKLARTEKLVIALLGVLKAGAAYLPLEASYPQARLDYMLSDSKASLVLDEALVDSVLEAEYPQHDEGLPTVNSDDLAYLIYTSGSTGNPKGVMVTHGNVVNFITAMTPYLEPRAQNTWLAVTGIAFDISVLELFGALANGFKVVLYAADDISEKEANTAANDISSLVEKYQVSHLQCTPSFAAMHLMADDELSSLRHIFIGGEVFPSQLASQLASLKHIKVHNMYGPTEATVWCSEHLLEPGASKIPIGKPLAGYEIQILDKDFNKQPIGIPGELFIAGKGVTKGYYQHPELTLEKFIEAPFEKGSKCYRSGDKARWNHNGQLEFLGRIDSQIKLRGHRIEPDEIACKINSLEFVENAVVVLDELNTGARLAAYIKPKHWPVDTDSLYADVKQYLAQHLPNFMVPTAYLALETLPLTLNGKVNKAMLPKVDVLKQIAKFSKPATETERQLVQIWAKLLAVDPSKISCNVSFFDLGGHSLLLTKMIAELKSSFDAELSIRELFENATIQALANVLDTMDGKGGNQELHAKATNIDQAQTEELVL